MKYKTNGLDYDEGWSVFERDDGSLHIQRLDCPRDARKNNPERPMFASDADALAFVRAKAEAGSEYHADALALHGTRPEWSGSPDPADPDNYWIDDKTGERVKA